MQRPDDEISVHESGACAVSPKGSIVHEGLAGWATATMEERFDALLGEAEHLQAERSRIPWWRFLRRRRVTNLWLFFVAEIERIEQYRLQRREPTLRRPEAS